MRRWFAFNAQTILIAGLSGVLGLVSVVSVVLAILAYVKVGGQVDRLDQVTKTNRVLIRQVDATTRQVFELRKEQLDRLRATARVACLRINRSNAVLVDLIAAVLEQPGSRRAALRSDLRELRDRDCSRCDECR